MCNEIKQIIDSCDRCQQIRPSQPKEPDIKTVASFPMENVSLDLFHLANKTFLVMVDRYSGFPFVEHLKSTSTEGVTRTLRTWFYDFGVPVRLRSDGGPQFRSEFQDFCKKLGIIHELASPYNPRSNGHAEAAVKNMKYLLEKYDGNWNKFKSALLEWRNTPSSSDAISPAQKMFGRRQRTEVPAANKSLLKTPNLQNLPLGLAQEKVQHEQNDQSVEEERKQNRELPKLAPNTIVRVQDPCSKRWDSSAKIIEIRDNGRSYVLSQNGKKTIRNRRFLKPMRETTVMLETDETSDKMAREPLTYGIPEEDIHEVLDTRIHDDIHTGAFKEVNRQIRQNEATNDDGSSKEQLSQKKQIRWSAPRRSIRIAERRIRSPVAHRR